MREVRKLLGHSQESFGELCGVDKRQVGRWESGDSYPRIQTLEKLAELSGKPVWWFFTDEYGNSYSADSGADYQVGGYLPIGEILLQGIRQQLDEPAWTEEDAADHQGELLARARKRLGINQEVMGEQVLGWGSRRLAAAEKGGPLSVAELSAYLKAIGISLDPPAWYAPTELVGKTTNWETDESGQTVAVPMRFKTKVEPTTWCPTCELFRLLYPDFCCSRHRDSGWALEEAMRRLKRANAAQRKAERALERALEERKGK